MLTGLRNQRNSFTGQYFLIEWCDHMYLVLFFIFLSTVMVLLQIQHLLTKRERLIENRLKVVLSTTKIERTNKSIGENTKRRSFKHLLGSIGRLSNNNYANKFQDKLLRAGVPLKPEEFVGLNILSILVATSIGIFILHQTVIAAILAILAFILPRVSLGFLEKRKVLKIENQLLDMTILLSNSLRAGHSFVQALELAGRESPLPLATEIQKVIREIQVGSPLEDALGNLSRRVNSKDLEMLVTGVLIQRQVGGNMAEILDTITTTIERRIKSRAKIRALTAQGRISAWIVSLLPFALAAFIFGKSPEFGMVLIVEPLGRLMLGAGVFALILGIIWIKAVVNVEV
jgi:tight adherence protein B